MFATKLKLWKKILEQIYICLHNSKICKAPVFTWIIYSKIQIYIFLTIGMTQEKH